MWNYCYENHVIYLHTVLLSCLPVNFIKSDSSIKFWLFTMYLQLYNLNRYCKCQDKLSFIPYPPKSEIFVLIIRIMFILSHLRMNCQLLKLFHFNSIMADYVSWVNHSTRTFHNECVLTCYCISNSFVASISLILHLHWVFFQVLI
jgi:hypothetical protein